MTGPMICKQLIAITLLTHLSFLYKQFDQMRHQGGSSALISQMT